ncbi:inhibitor of growth proteins N-terminal histone-binding-domain-containing protein [Xylariaceae sp. FL0255]|nr:inhibitor of growth proteins N-terminal histone-binding-domain-containing protein [Xylariaceae sp. FL0255]
MPRDDLSIDFVKKMGPAIEAQDPAVILEEFIHRTANLPEEIRFLQDEITEKDRSYHDCIKAIEESDNKIQRWIRQNGSHQANPRESQLRDLIKDNYSRAEALAEEKLVLSLRAQILYDKHLRHLDEQIKALTDRGEPGFTDPDEIPSLVRASAANHSDVPPRVLAVTKTATPLNPIHNNATPPTVRLSTQIRVSQSTTHVSSSAPATPAASMILNRNQRESSAGPGSGVPKRGPRAASGLGTLPANSSGLARHSSLGPGTPKAGTPGASSRAGSAGPKGVSKPSANGPSRKGTPGAVAGRKKPPTSKSTLSRVKRVGQSKGSPASTADSELSDAESAPSSHRGSRAGSGTPGPHHHAHTKHVDRDEDMADRDDDNDVSGSDAGSGMDEDEDEEGKRYCLCQAVSYGDMVACDNPSCPYEWFHWTCVGLKSEPEGRWYCPTCTTERENLKKKVK